MNPAPAMAVAVGKDSDALGTPRQPYYLHPGQLFAPAEPHAVTTVLGSCVAVCLWDRRRRIGGINHYMLPDRGADVAASPKFGVVAIRRLLDALYALGARRGDLCAKVFGGACVIAGIPDTPHHLGAQNARLAAATLAAEGICVLVEDTGGRRARRLVFHTDAGDAWIRLI